MAKERKASVAEYVDAMRRVRKEAKHVKVYNLEGSEVSFIIKEHLSLEERASMVRDIAGMIFITDANGVERYCPYLKTFSLFYNMVAYFTNIALPKTSERAWEFCSQTPIIQDIFDVVDSKYIRLIEQDANALVEFKKEQILHQSKLDSFLQDFGNLVKEIQEKVGGLTEENAWAFVKKYMPGFDAELQKVLQEKPVESAGK